jgi:hypothetical protein
MIGFGFAPGSVMTSLEFVNALRPHGYQIERNGEDRITLVRSGDRRRVSVPPNQLLFPRTVRLLLLSAEVDEATFDARSTRH